MIKEKSARLEKLIRSYFDLDDLVNSIIARNTDEEADELIGFLEKGENVTMQELILFSIDLKRARKNGRIPDQGQQ